MEDIFMRTYFAVQQHKTINAGWQQCLKWARQQIHENDAPVHLLTARGDDQQAIIIAEVTTDHERMIEGGRAMSIKSVMHG